MVYKSISRKVFELFNILLLTTAVLVIITPYLYLISVAFSDSAAIRESVLFFIPRHPTLANFRIVLNGEGFYSSVAISVLRTLLGTVLTLLITFSAAYGFSRKAFPGKKLFLAFLMLPFFFSPGLIPTFILYYDLRLIDSFAVYILPFLFSVFNMVVMRTYIKSAIPDSLEEAAKIDGAHEITIFFRIIIPLSKPILATVAIWTAVAHWNDWTTTLFYVSEQSLFTMQFKVRQLIQDSQNLANLQQQAIMNGEIPKSAPSIQEYLIAAQVFLTSIPIMLVYPFLQKYFVNGVALGSIKE